MPINRRELLAAGTAAVAVAPAAMAGEATVRQSLSRATRTALAAGEVTVTGANGITRYSLSTTEDARAGLLSVFEDALSQLPAHIEFGPGDLHILNRGISIVLPKGGRGLSISGNSTRLRLSGASQFSGHWHCLRMRTDDSSVNPASGETLRDEDYFSDLSVTGITFYDDAPALHAQVGAEETHGLNLQWVRNAQITNCVVDNVGDEGIELDYCKNVVITGNVLSNTTQQELSGGGAISIKQGCENVSITGNTIKDGGGTSTYGVAIKVIFPIPVRNITIAANTIGNMSTHGIQINIAGNGNNRGSVLVDGVSITGNTFSGAQYGIALRGGMSNQHTAQAIDISGNTFTGQSSGGIRMFSANYHGLEICNNHFGDMDGAGILAQGTSLLFADNEMVDVRDACIRLQRGDGASINGGIYRRCGEFADALFVEEGDFSDGSLLGVHVSDCKAAAVVKDIRHISGCTMSADEAGLTLASRMIDIRRPEKGAASITNNRLHDGCIELAAGNSIVAGNWISHTRDLGANGLRIATDASNCLISGNHIAAHATHYAIEIAGNTALVTGNHLAASGKAILDTGQKNAIQGNMDSLTRR